jgi:hypothetical protein
MHTAETVEGRLLSGNVLVSGADWILFDADGEGQLYVRITLETQDGAHIHVQYYGVIIMNEKLNAAFEQGESKEYGHTYWGTPLFYAPRLQICLAFILCQP